MKANKIFLATGSLLIPIFGIAILLGLSAVLADEEKVSLQQVPPAVRATIEKYAAGGEIEEIDREEEGGVVVYEAEVIVNGVEVDILVSAAGEFLGSESEEDEEGEVEDEGEDEDGDDDDDEAVSWDQLPPAVAATIEQYAAGGEIAEIDREEEDGVVVYEAEVIVDGEEVDLLVSATGEYLGIEAEDDDDGDDDEAVSWDQLPPAVAATIEQYAAGGEIAEIDREEEGGVVVYEAEVIVDGEEVDLLVSATGEYLGIEAEDDDDDDDDEVSLEELPPAVRATIEQYAAGGEIEGIDLEEEDGEVVYEADIIVNGEEIEILVSATGEYLGTEAENEDDEDEYGEDEDDDEKLVSWDGVPAAVRAAIEQYVAGVGGEIGEIDQDEGDGVYEADIIVNGEEIDLLVSATGEILGTEAD